ncbi:unnamed protein product [Prorocentrum cordatum]|uniref:Uncharacterized protein n=1 Tax=Prorocentrum cordatum TaxID=2364126 RepID=A0ABN9RKZ1_9DINO|nr:unnamed protein product [Polarella glacialis]
MNLERAAGSDGLRQPCRRAAVKLAEGLRRSLATPGSCPLVAFEARSPPSVAVQRASLAREGRWQRRIAATVQARRGVAGGGGELWRRLATPGSCPLVAFEARSPPSVARAAGSDGLRQPCRRAVVWLAGCGGELDGLRQPCRRAVVWLAGAASCGGAWRRPAAAPCGVRGTRVAGSDGLRQPCRRAWALSKEMAAGSDGLRQPCRRAVVWLAGCGLPLVAFEARSPPSVAVQWALSTERAAGSDGLRQPCRRAVVWLAGCGGGVGDALQLPLLPLVAFEARSPPSVAVQWALSKEMAAGSDGLRQPCRRALPLVAFEARSPLSVVVQWALSTERAAGSDGLRQPCRLAVVWLAGCGLPLVAFEARRAVVWLAGCGGELWRRLATPSSCPLVAFEARRGVAGGLRRRAVAAPGDAQQLPPGGVRGAPWCGWRAAAASCGGAWRRPAAAPWWRSRRAVVWLAGCGGELWRRLATPSSCPLVAFEAAVRGAVTAKAPRRTVAAVARSATRLEMLDAEAAARLRWRALEAVPMGVDEGSDFNDEWADVPPSRAARRRLRRTGTEAEAPCAGAAAAGAAAAGSAAGAAAAAGGALVAFAPPAGGRQAALQAERAKLEAALLQRRAAEAGLGPGGRGGGCGPGG